MGKSRKFSKGLPNGFVPEYRHAVETMAESEGLGSSGRVDTDMSLCDASYTRRHKYSSLNGDGCNRFGIPVQFLSLSNMSMSERRILGLKLQRELEQVKILQEKIASMNFDTSAKPSSSVCNAGKKRPPIQSIVPKQHPSGKKQARGGGNGSSMKRGIPEHAIAASGVYNLVRKHCEGLLNQLMKHKNGWLFNNPVDVVELNIPDYFTIIKNPMDFGTIKGKIVSGRYSSALEFAADVRLTFANAMTYNPAQNNVHIMAKDLSKYFELKWKTIEKKIPGGVQMLYSEKDASHVKNSDIDKDLPMKKNKLPLGAGSRALKPETINNNMPEAEKERLIKELDSVLAEAELPDSIIELLKDSSSSAAQTADDEIEIDIHSLNEDTLLKLRMFLDDYLMEKKKGTNHGRPCEVELHNEGIFNKLPMQRGKVNDAVEEDIDIGGNDSPILSFPPIEIEKETAHEVLQANSSSSSSSSSGSSSNDSDSDSGGSSGSGCGGTKAPRRLKNLEVIADETSNHKWINTKDSDIRTENFSAQAEQNAATVPIPVEGCGQAEDNTKDSDIRTENFSAQAEQNAATVPIPVEWCGQAEGNTKDSDIRTETFSAQAEQNAATVPTSVEVCGQAEGESAPFERQVSPEKVYRAALLRNRFADTILKAQEKALDKGVKKDPEKLRIDREELERMQKKEKARLQAAAFAAEEARKKAGADAAAEAIRKREMEREAARIALQKMEKTVDINETCKLLEDLEMLRADPAEDRSSLAEDANHEHPESMLGSFKLKSSRNPLELLGLYMKLDEEEEDISDGEAPTLSTPYTVNDDEEGLRRD